MNEWCLLLPSLHHAEGHVESTAATLAPCTSFLHWAPAGTPSTCSSKSVQLLWSLASSLGKHFGCFGLCLYRKPCSQHIPRAGSGENNLNFGQRTARLGQKPFQKLAQSLKFVGTASHIKCNLQLFQIFY